MVLYSDNAGVVFSVADVSLSSRSTVLKPVISRLDSSTVSADACVNVVFSVCSIEAFTAPQRLLAYVRCLVLSLPSLVTV